MEVNWHPSDRQLRQFGLAALVALPLSGWWWRAGSCLFLGLTAAGTLLALLGFLRPQWLRPMYRGLNLITLPVGVVIAEVMLFLFYFAVFVPIGLFFRLVGRDVLQQKLEPEAKTYWQPRGQATDPRRYFQPW